MARNGTIVRHRAAKSRLEAHWDESICCSLSDKIQTTNPGLIFYPSKRITKSTASFNHALNFGTLR